MYQPLRIWIFENQRWRRPPFWKTIKSPYLRKRLTDFDRIWRGDAHRYSGLYWTLKIALFHNSTWRTAAIVKNRKIARMFSISDWTLHLTLSQMVLWPCFYSWMSLFSWVFYHPCPACPFWLFGYSRLDNYCMCFLPIHQYFDISIFLPDQQPSHIWVKLLHTDDRHRKSVLVKASDVKPKHRYKVCFLVVLK